ncbi:MAG: pantoate--beta-alanine ligase [Candidatus Cloacimonetes bacterium]|nr:pantoate--beta-alanine ligase [Candidatus Cloacimonadota bacterium]
MRELTSHLRKKNNIIGFVPTMGYLHKGHLSLVQKAKEMSDIVIVSIYVNPAQFSQGEDLSRYPRSIDHDLKLLENLNADYVFIPQDDQMYDPDHKTWVHVTELEDKLCGKSRLDHFRGVATIVLKLLNIVIPDLMFMGEKDYQQVVILEKMISDLDLQVRIIRCPTVREADGLAMSSRNSYLSSETRKNAASIFQSLKHAKEIFHRGITDVKEVIREMKIMIESKGGKIDYIEAFNSKTLQQIDHLSKGSRIALAVFFDSTRLIDNIEI